MGRLDDIDLTQRLEREEYQERLLGAQRRFLDLRLQLGGQTSDGDIGPGLLVVVEGVDAGGKGGAIKRLVALLDPRHYDVYAYSKPSEREKRHHFLWRFWNNVPGSGGMCVFDRSWYGRVLVERVEGFATEAEWRRGYESIVRFERSMAIEGVIVAKFWFQVSQQEQLKRFKSRLEDPFRRWKMTDEDWRNRDKWDLYKEAVEEMFERTDHELAPWNVIAGEQKKFARVQMIETLNERIVEGVERYERGNLVT